MSIERSMNYKFKTKPYKHQLKALEKSWEKSYFAYFMEMGTGKSKVLVDNLAMLYDKGKIKFLLDERAQMIFSPGPLILKLKRLLKDFKQKDYLLLTGDPAIIGVACSIVSDTTNGKYNLLKWDKQERRYYPVEICLLYTSPSPRDGLLSRMPSSA